VARADQYSLGRLCLWLCGATAPEALVAALARATSVDRALRFPQLEDFLATLERHAGGPAPAPCPVDVKVSPGRIHVTVGGPWTRQSVETCAGRIEAALVPPGPWRIAYHLASSAGYRQAGVIEALTALHRRRRALVDRVAFLAADPQARGLGVVLGSSVDGLPWRAFASADTMRAWLETGSAR
jgi:hypothetical protein